jgi:hypothetical protein
MYRIPYADLQKDDVIKPHFWSKPIKICRLVTKPTKIIGQVLIIVEGFRQVSKGYGKLVKARFLDYPHQFCKQHKCWIIADKLIVNKWYDAAKDLEE